MVHAIFFGLLGPLVLSALGPIYFGVTNAPYSMTLIWAMCCALWWALQPIKAALTDRNWLQPRWYKCVTVGSVVAILAFAFVLGDSLAYQLAGRYQTQILALIRAPGSATANIRTNGGTE